VNDHISYQGNPETRAAAPVQFFEAADESPPAGAKATPRPADRPREVPPASSAVAVFQSFESQGISENEGDQTSLRPGDNRR